MCEPLEGILSSPLFGAVVGGLITGVLTFIATWWTLTRGFKNQIKLLTDDQMRQEKAAGWALIAEMSETMTRLKLVDQLVEKKSPVNNIRRSLRVSRYVFDRQLPLLGQSLGLAKLAIVSGAYATISSLFAILEGKWEPLPPNRTASEEDAKAIKVAADDFEENFRSVAKAILDDDELREAGLAD